MVGKIKQKGLFPVRVYLTEGEITPMVKEAEKAGFRRVGIPIKRQKPHGLASEWLANADGVGPFLKACFTYYCAHEAERLKEAAEIAAQKRELAEREAALQNPALLMKTEKSGE